LLVTNPSKDSAFPVPVRARKPKKPSPTHKKALTEARDRENAERAKTSISLLRLVRLFAGDEDGDKESDYGAIAPTPYALQTALLLVAGAIKIRGGDIPSSPVVDSEGGIRITWRRGDRTIKLICPATKDGPLYVYQSFAGANSLQNQNVTAEALAARLSSLIGREPTAPEPDAE
jgi:hypothetical protein